MVIEIDRTKRTSQVRRSLDSFRVAVYGHRRSVEVGRVFGPRKLVVFKTNPVGKARMVGVGLFGWGACWVRWSRDRRWAL